MITKKDLVDDWLPRYTGTALEDLGRHILLTGFTNSVESFAPLHDVPISCRDRAVPNAPAKNISVINVAMRSAHAATIMDLLSAIPPRAVLLLAKCGGLRKKNRIGALTSPIPATCGEGTSGDYMPANVPALPSFDLQRAVSHTFREYDLDDWTGTVSTTNRRVWQHDDAFKRTLVATRAMAIDVETATLSIAGFANEIPRRTLLLVSDQPMNSRPVPTETREEQVTQISVETPLRMEIDSLKEIRDQRPSVNLFRFA